MAGRGPVAPRWLVGAALVVTVRALATAGLANADAGPWATASPATNLIDGQRGIVVRGGGFPAYRTIQVEECVGTVGNPPPDNTSCEGDTIDTQAVTDGHGAFANAPMDSAGHTGYEAFRLPSPTLHAATSIPCDASHPCVLYVGIDQNDFAQPHTFVAITFAPGNAVAPGGSAPTTVVTPVTATQSAISSATPSSIGTVAPARPASGAVVANADPAVTLAGTALASTGPPRAALPVAMVAGLVSLLAALTRRRALHPRPERSQP